MSFRLVRTRWWWLLLPALALLFTLAAGRSWPFTFGRDFPKVVGEGAHPAKTGTLLVYSPGAQTVKLRVRIVVDKTDCLPPLNVTVANGEITSSTTSFTTHAGELQLDSTMPVHLTSGINSLRLSLGTEPMDFMVESAALTQPMFTSGNLLFTLVVVALGAASILAARALGASGLHQFCASSVIGFLLVTGTGTVVSLFHGLTAGIWGGSLLAVSTAVGAWAATGRRPVPAAPENSLRPLETIVLLAVALPSFVLHLLLPIAQWDDLMYHAPRAAYWMQNASALPFVSHDDRLSVFPIGGDLLYACGVILSGAELPGKFLGGLALPLTLFAIFAVLKNMRVRPFIAVALIVVFATVPLVTTGAIMIKPDLWLVLMSVATLHWILVARRSGSTIPPAVVACLAAAAAGAAFGVKWTAAPIFLFLPYALRREDWHANPVRSLWPPAVAFVLAIALGGAGPILVTNLQASHHPFGPRSMQEFNRPSGGLHTMFVQFKRLPFLLYAVPYFPGAGAQESFARWEANTAEAVGATERLRQEDDPMAWPGQFMPHVLKADEKFSLAWAVATVGVIAGVAAYRRWGDREARREFLLAVGMAALFVVAVVTQTRWQAAASIPERFLPPALAFGLIASGRPLDWLLGRRKLGVAVVAAVVTLHAIPYGLTSVTAWYYVQDHGWRAPKGAHTKAPLDGLAHMLPPGRTILFFADQSAREYPLFLGQEGFANRVLPWGKAPYEPRAFDAAVKLPGVDTVLFTAGDRIEMLWDPALDPRPFIADMETRPEFARLPATGEAVVFVKKK